MPSADAYFQVADERLTFLRQQVMELKATDKLYHQSAEGISETRDTIWRQLSGYLLPEIDEPTLAAAQAKIHFPGLLPIHRDFTQQLQAIQARREALNAREEVAHRGITEAPIHDQLAEITPSLDALEKEETWWSREYYYKVLVQNTWFNSGSPQGLFRRFANWRSASFLMRAAERKLKVSFKDSDDLRQYVNRMQADLRPLRELRAALTARLQEIAELNGEYKETLQAPMKLGVAMFEALSAAIREALETTPTEDLFRVAKGDKHLTMFLKRTIGMGKQQSYLRELRVSRIKPLITQTNKQISKLERKVSKRRAKHWRGKFNRITQTEYEGLKEFKAEKWQKRQKRLAKLHQRIDGFDRHSEGSFGQHFLWWDFITKNAPGEDLYEVRTFKASSTENHPHALLEATLSGEDASAQSDSSHIGAAAADAMADDMLAGSDDWGSDVS